MAFSVQEIRFWCRRDTAANWTSVNPILSSGEWGVETDNTGSTPRKYKMGDGVTAWTSLPYSNPGSFVEDAIADGVTTKAPSQNAVYDALALKANLAGGTFTGDISVPDEAYDATAWNGSLEVPTKNAVRDKIEALSAGSGAMTNLGTATVTGSAATTLAISGLDLSAYKAFLVTFALDNATGSSGALSLFYNSDTTATNYQRQRISATSTTVAGGRSNDPALDNLVANETNTGYAWISNDRDGKPRAWVFSSSAAPASVALIMQSIVWNSATNITGITISSSVANSLAIGSTFTVFGVS